MKKLFWMPLAVLAVFALAFAGCGGGGGGDPDPDPDADTFNYGNMGKYELNEAGNQAFWVVPVEKLGGATITFTFEKAVAGGMQLIFQTWDAEEEGFTGWWQFDFTDDSGAVKTAFGDAFTISADKKTLTVDTEEWVNSYDNADKMDDYEDAVAAIDPDDDIKIWLAYYSPDISGLGKIKADLSTPGSGDDDDAWVLYEDGEWADGVTAAKINNAGSDGSKDAIEFTPALDVSDYTKVVLMYPAGDYTSWWVGGKTEDSTGHGDADWLGDDELLDKDGNAVFPIETIDNLKLIILEGGGNDGDPFDFEKIMLVP